MKKNFKITRDYQFKAYKIDKDQVEVDKNRHNGEFLFKSECHYYVSKFIIDLLENIKDDTIKINIYQVGCREDDNRCDKLIESYFIDNDQIKIDACLD